MTETVKATCPERPWYDGIGCDQNPDGVHRYLPGENAHTVHRCRCGAADADADSDANSVGSWIL